MKKWIVGAALVGLGGCTLFYLFSEDNKVSMQVSRTVLLSILKELRRELAGPLISLADMAKWVKSEYTYSQQSEIESIIRKNSNYIQQIELIQDRIFSRYNLTRSQVESALEDAFINDTEIQGIVNEIKEAIQQAYQGKIPRLENSIPSFVNESLVLSVLKEIYIFTLTTAYNKVQELVTCGINLNGRSKELDQAELEIEELVECEKQEIFKRYGLLYLEDSPSNIIHTAGVAFSRTSAEFARKLGKIEEEYRNNLEKIMKGLMKNNEFLDLR